MKRLDRPNLLAREDLAPVPQQQRSSAKRARLKKAALELFGKLGYERASVEQIAARAALPVGTFYQHFRSKRQLLLVLMDELLEQMSRLDFTAPRTNDVRVAIHNLLARAFSYDLSYLGAYRAWREAVLADAILARQHKAIRSWTTQRVQTFFLFLQRLPNAREGVDVAALARSMDTFFWSLLDEALLQDKNEIMAAVETSTHLVYHALFEG